MAASAPPQQSSIFALLCGVAAVAGLYLAKEILLPFAMAVFLSFLLAPLVSRLETWKFPRIAAVLTSVALAFAGLAALGSTLVRQIYEFADRLPEYETNLIQKAQALQSGQGGIVAKVSAAIEDMGEQLSSGRAGAHARPATTSGSRSRETVAEPSAAPVPVEVVSPLSRFTIAQGVFGPLLRPLGTAAMVIVFVIFMLIEREALRNRLIHLVGSRQLNLTTQALDDAARRITRYLLMQLTVNAIFGVVIAVGLLVIGLPNAILWGVLAMFLRFLPYVGAWISAAIPLALSLAVFDGWTRPLLVLCLFLLNELVGNNVLEPWLYGASTGISNIGILVSAVFWTWLWGPVGLIMATPLTVCVMVIGRYVPQLTLLHTLLSDEQALSPADRFYQRLLALDPDEAIEVAEEFLRANSLESLYDAVLLPALRSAEEDRHRGDLEESRLKLIHLTVRELVEDLATRERPLLEGDEAGAREIAVLNGTAEVLCLPARDEADEIVAIMLADLLDARHVKTMVISTRALASEMLAQVGGHDPRVVCVSALPPFAATHARYLCKRLRPTFPGLPIVTGLWQANGGGKKAQERLIATGIDGFATNLADATEQIVKLWSSRRATPAQV